MHLLARFLFNRCHYYKLIHLDMPDKLNMIPCFSSLDKQREAVEINRYTVYLCLHVMLQFHSLAVLEGYLLT